MAQLTITIPDGQIDRVREAFGNGSPTTDPQEQPHLATLQEVKDSIISYVQNRVREYERQKAAATAMQSVVVIDAT